MDSKHLVTVILVEPQDPINIGSVARAMMNLGFNKLRLVAPVGYSKDRALKSACWAEPILSDATIYSELRDALSDQQLAVGFTARGGKNRPTTAIDSWLSKLSGMDITRIALVFGPEDCGLRQEHQNLLNELVTIPANEEYPCFNLAQAVLLALYETSKVTLVDRSSNQAPNIELTKQVDVLMESLIEKSDFLNKGTPHEVHQLLKGMFRRIPIRNERELAILTGFFSRLEKSIVSNPTRTEETNS